MPEEKRAAILSELAKLTGRRLPAAFIQHTADYVPGVDRFHTLFAGIYKPAWSDYALSIVMKLESPYEKMDEVVFLDDGRWLMTYSPRAGGLDLSDNRAVMKCMKERVPVGVLLQLTSKADRQHGSTYQVLGLGLVTSYDQVKGVFIIEGADQTALEQVTGVIPDEERRYEAQLYARVTNEFRPFVKDEGVVYTVSAAKRDEAFRQIVLREYDFACAICDMKFRLGNLVEATAAHIVSKHQHGTDDPRNGLSLCQTHHWAFDKGIFTLSDSYEIMLGQTVEQAETRNFELLSLNGKPAVLPKNEVLRPHPDALAWHREHVWVK